MEIKINEPVSSVEEISSAAYNVLVINSIKIKHEHWRQMSKAPTFALT